MSGLLPYTIYYENTAGERLELSELPFIVTGGQLFDSKWKLTTVSRLPGEGIRLLRAGHSPDERTLTVRAAAGSAAELTEKLRYMSDVFDYDIAKLSPGRLWINGQYMTCWCTARQKELSCDFTATAAVTVSILPQRPVWCREKHYVLVTDPDRGVMASPDYVVNIGTNEMTVKNTSRLDAPAKIIFYGPAVNPYVFIDGEQVGLSVELENGEYAVIDQADRTVYKVGSHGEKTNCFNWRIKNGKAFSPLPSGESTIISVGVIETEVVVTEQRSEPEWSLI